MLLSSDHGFAWIPWIAQHVAGAEHLSATAIALWSAIPATILFVTVGIVIRRHVIVPENYIVPDRRATLTNWFDLGVNWLVDLMEDVMGPSARQHFPFLGAIFFYILCSNLLGLIPGMTTTTSNLNTNLAIGASVFLYYHYRGIKAHGLGNYVKHFMGPLIWIAPLFFVIELVSHLVRPLSLSIRLFGNMTVDHAVLGVFTDLTKVIIPVVFLGLGAFVCFVQAFVFTLLSTVYIALAEAHEGGHEQHEHH